MKVPFTLGEVGHFGLAVRDPEKSAQWFQNALGLRKEFAFGNGVAIGNDNVTIALFKGKPSPETIDHMSFHLPDMATLKIRATKSARKLRDQKTWAFGSTIPTVTAGS
jgi:catechol 2,3-dioxygenase-like lactoylglutathione lyase family enzyme